jgi:putative hemolysin
MVIEIGLIVLLVLLNGVFSGTELAMVSAKRGRLQQQAEIGSGGAQAALRLQAEPNRLLSTVQIGITLIGTIAGAYGGASIAERLTPVLAAIPAFAPVAETVAFTLVVIVITYLSLVLGELVPKRLALQSAEAIAVVMARPMEIIALIARPIVAVLGWSTEGILRLLGRRGAEGPSVTEEDIRQLVREGAEEGAVEHEERQYIERVFDLGDRRVRQIMTPRRSVTVLAGASQLSAVMDLLLETGYSRFPVYGDRPDDIIGVVHVRDVLRYSHGGNEAATVREVMRPPLGVPDSMRADDLLRLFRSSRQHLAIVVDELGSFEGIATLEDVIEELVGDIADEHDDAAQQHIIERDDGSLLLDGQTPIAEALAALGFEDVPDDERGHYDTVAGFVLDRFGRLPRTGERVDWSGWRFEVLDMDGLRVDKVLAIKLPDAPETRT